MIFFFFLQEVPVPVTVTPSERASALRSLYPSSGVRTMNQKKKYVCAVCKSVCDLFGLFLHMKQVPSLKRLDPTGLDHFPELRM